ncbi:hypothetical protein [Gallibacterium salpingitidis]|uniref:hypothetical protein n=1 Tax=Gallibacterium salpingitidis TaxID=505341 RepID=UPI000824BF4F|nr:hypothetical protein [Gallibacterium salpingitidis]
MGYGGILAAMAAGLGTGIVKNVENGWKEEAAQKEMDWRSKEYALGRKHDFDLEDKRYQNEISKMAIQAQYDLGKIGYQHRLDNSNQNKDADAIMNGIIARREKINTLDSVISSLTDPDQKKQLIEQRDNEKKQLDFYVSRPEVKNIYNSLSVGDKEIFSAASGVPTDDYANYQAEQDAKLKAEQEAKAKADQVKLQQQNQARVRAAQQAEQARIAGYKGIGNATRNSSGGNWSWSQYYNQSATK